MQTWIVYVELIEYLLIVNNAKFMLSQVENNDKFTNEGTSIQRS